MKHQKNLSTVIVLIAVIAAAGLLTCRTVTVETSYRNGIVVSSSPIASQVGLGVLRGGGNAFDAAVAVGFCLAVCYPEAGNIGGGGFALVYSSSDKRIEALDFREKAPQAATVDMYLDESGEVIPDKSLVGAGAAGVPGTVAGLFELWQKYGSQEWSSLLAPAAALADSGLVIDPELAQSLARHSTALSEFPATKTIYFNGERPYHAGERLFQKDLAATLEKIAGVGRDGFYLGETAELIVATMGAYDGLITREDLALYRPVWREPIRFEFDSMEIYSMPPPSSGGVILAQILKLLEPFDLAEYSPASPEYIHLFTETCRLAFADRAVHLGDPDFHKNPIEELVSPAYVDIRRKLIDIIKAQSSAQIGAGLTDKDVPAESESTTHICVADQWDNVVSLTYTINAAYGSKLVVDGAGFLLNNEMDDFSIKPGQSNLYGLVGGKANEIAPEKRMLSSMSPTLVFLKSRPFLALGSPGGPKIITTVAQAIIAVGRFGLSPREVVGLPRFHHQWLPDSLYLEERSFDSSVINDLVARGHAVRERSKYSDLQILQINADGSKIGASDPRRGGRPAGY
jgi:gamma-glutamyltranspeptidase/glutathione hydrolase